MRAWVVGLAMLLSSVVAADPSPRSVTIRFVGPKVGESWQERISSIMSIRTTGKPAQLGERKELHRQVHVLAVDGNTIARANIRYRSYAVEIREDQQLTRKPGPRLGATYTLTAGSPNQVRRDGKVVAESEAALVRALGVDDPVGQMLGGKTFVIDRPVVMSAGDLAGFARAPLRPTTWIVIFRAMVDGNARFDMEIVSASADGRTTITVTGKLLVDPNTGRKLQETLQGKIVLAGVGQGTIAYLFRRDP